MRIPTLQGSSRAGSPVQKGTAENAGRLEPSILTTAKGSSILFSSRLVAYGLRFLIGIILARLLGPEELGLYRLSLTTVALVSGFALLGLNRTLVRYISLYSSRKDAAGLWGALQVGIGLPTLLGLLAAVGLFFLAVPIAEGLYAEPALVPLLRLGCVLLVIEIVLKVAAAATRGSKAMHYSALAVQIVVPVLRLALIVVVGLTIGLSAATALGTYIVAMLAGAVLLLYFVDQLYSLRHPLRQARRDSRELVSFALPVYLSDRLVALGTSLRTILLGALSTTANVGVFAVATQVNTVSQMFHGAITTASAPVFAELHDRGELGRMKTLYQTATKWTLALNLPFFLVIVMFPEEILYVFGASFVGGAAALSILAWATLVNTSTGIGGVLIVMTGHSRLRLLNSAVRLALAVGLGFLLIPAWDVVGAAAGALVSGAVVSLLCLVEVYILFGFLPYNVTFLKPVAAGLAATAMGLGINHLLPIEHGLIQAFVSAAVLVATYVGMLLMLRLPPEDRALLALFTRRLNAIRLSSQPDEDSAAEKEL